MKKTELPKAMSIVQIKNCKDNDLLRKQRDFLMENVSRLVKSDKNEDGVMSFKDWEDRICHIDLRLEGIPLKVYLPSAKGHGVTAY